MFSAVHTRTLPHAPPQTLKQNESRTVNKTRAEHQEGKEDRRIDRWIDVWMDG